MFMTGFNTRRDSRKQRGETTALRHWETLGGWRWKQGRGGSGAAMMEDRNQPAEIMREMQRNRGKKPEQIHL